MEKVKANRRMNNSKTIEKPTAIVLGGTVPHAELIRQLKERGYNTVLVDYFENPPAAQYADVHCKDSAMDYEAVLRIAREYDAKLVLSSCLDQQINIAMKVAEELNISHPFSTETAQNVTNKRLMKKIMIENDIPTARYKMIDNNFDYSSMNLTYPLIVKPTDSCGSAGIHVLYSEDEEEFRKAVEGSLHFSPSGSVLVEEYIVGTEMAAHGYIAGGKANILFGTCKISAMNEGITTQLCNLYIPKLKDSLQEKLEMVANRIVKAFNLPEYSPLFMQFIVRDDDVYIIEFSPRVAGGTSSEVARLYTGFDLISYSIDSYLVKKENTQSQHKLEKYVCCLPIYANQGIFDHITGAEALKEEGVVHHEILLKSEGDEINWAKPSSANVMKYVLDGEDCNECLAKMERANRETDIIDKDGNSMRGDNIPIIDLSTFYGTLKNIDII